MRVKIIQNQDGGWEGLFVDGELISEGHTLGEGDPLFILKKAEKYNFKSTDVETFETNERDEANLSECGVFPKYLKDLTGNYYD